jgi:hypothetical protein
MAFNVKDLSTEEKVVLAAGLSMVLLAFLPGYGVHGGSVDKSFSVGNMGTAAQFGLLASFAAAGRIAMRAFGVQVPAPPQALAGLVLGMSLVGSLLFAYRSLHLPPAGLAGFAVRHEYGISLALVVSAIQTVAAARNYRETANTLA